MKRKFSIKARQEESDQDRKIDKFRLIMFVSTIVLLFVSVATGYFEIAATYIFELLIKLLTF